MAMVMAGEAALTFCRYVPPAKRTKRGLRRARGRSKANAVSFPLRVLRAAVDKAAQGVTIPMPLRADATYQIGYRSGAVARLAPGERMAWDGPHTEQVPMPQVSKARRVLVVDETDPMPPLSELRDQGVDVLVADDVATVIKRDPVTPTRYRGRRRDA